MKFYTKLFGRAFYYDSKIPPKINLDYYYIMNITCSNCGYNFEVYFRKGKYTKDVTSMIKCQNCRCTMKDCKCNTCQ